MLISPLPAPRVLIIDDDPDITSVISAALEAVGCQVTTENSALNAEQVCQTCEPDLILVDLMMPGRTGLELIEPLHAIRPDAMICMTTGLGDPAILKRSLKLGAWNVLCKPYSLDDLVELVNLSVRLSASLREEARAGVVEDRIELEFPGTHAPEPADLARLIAVAAASECDPDIAYRKLPLIATVLLDNAYKHGAQGSESARYGVKLFTDDDSVALTVWDSGIGFDAASQLKYVSASAPKGKLSGLQLVASLADDLRFNRTDNVITVVWHQAARNTPGSVC